MPSAFDGYEPNDYSHLGDDGDQSGSHAGYRHKDNRESPVEEALRLANRDKESILKRIETEIRSAEALPNTGEVNNLLRAGRLGALHLLKETFVGAGWIDPREPKAP